MSKQTKAIKRPVHRVPAIIAFVLAGIFLVLALAGAPAFYVFGAFSALCGLIWALGGGAMPKNVHLPSADQHTRPGKCDARSAVIYGDISHPGNSVYLSQNHG